MKIAVIGYLMLSLSAFALPATAEPLTLSAPEAQRMAAAGEVVLIDIRTPEEWRQTGVAQGATLIPLQHPDFVGEILRRVDGDRNAPIALICRTGNRTTQAQRLLTQEGFTRVYNVTEGMAGSAAGPGWLKRGLPVDRLD